MSRSNACKVDNTAREVESATRRSAELLASNSLIHRHGDVSPTRDFYSIRIHREDYGGGYVAHRIDWDSELKFRALYTKHDPDSLWSYTAPRGAKEIFE